MLCCGCSLNNHGKPQVLLWIRFVDRKENQPSFTGCPVKIFKKNEKKKRHFPRKNDKKRQKTKKNKNKIPLSQTSFHICLKNVLNNKCLFSNSKKLQ